MNHCIGDGTSLWYFITTLSEIFGQLKDEAENEIKFDEFSISRKPIFNILFPNSGYDTIFKVPYLEPDEFMYRYDPGPLRVRLFHFSSKSISMIKSKANEECGLHNNISSFQALCGLTWLSITRVRNLQLDLEVDCVIILNIRTRIDPPLPPEYFRCFIGGVTSVYRVGDILNNGLGQVALLINRSIKMQDEKAIRTMIKRSMDHPCVVQPGPSSVHNGPSSVIIGGSSKFDMYGPEFGLGKAIAVLAGYASKVDGKVTVNPGREGGGSVDLEICLKPETMNALELDEEFMSFTSSI